MPNETQKQTVSLEELMVSNLAMADVTAKLLIKKLSSPRKSSQPNRRGAGDLSRDAEAASLSGTLKHSIASAVACRCKVKVIYKITYPNGKIYIGKDLTGSAN